MQLQSQLQKQMGRLINGSSSLLFILSTIKAFHCSKLMTWKVCNCFLVVASFLCNASEYNRTFMLFDYLSICLTSTSYTNNIYVTITTVVFLMLEYKKYNNIETTKNIAFLTALGKTIVKTYYHVDRFHYYLIVGSSVSGIAIYGLRYYSQEYYARIYKLQITWLFHLCVTAVLWVSSITAN